MARRFKKRPKIPTPFTTDDDLPSNVDPAPIATDETQIILDRIRTACNPDILFSLKAPTMAPVKHQDGNYKTLAISTEMEFAFIGARQGARGQIIFEFKPLDPLYQQIEFPENKVFDALDGDFEKMVCEALGVGDDIGFDFAKKVFIRRETERKAKEEAKRVEDEQQTLADRHKNNPLFGTF